MYNLFSKKANLKKNILSICSAIMLLMFLVAALPAQVYAQFAGGAGTSEDPYRIETAVHLNNVRDHLDAYFVLENDIDLDEAPYNEGEGWEPIGTEADRFTGNFDGQGYVIENLFIDRPNTDYVGLFGYVEWGEVENVGLENVNVTGEVQVGGLVGRNLYGNVSNSYATGDVTGNEHVGGLVGLHIAFNILHQVSNSYAAVDVTGEDVVGGLVGTIQGPDGNLTTSTVSNSYATGDVTGNRFVGGLIGRIIVGWVSNSYATGNVMRTSGESTSLGGFIGEILESRIRHCYSTGSVIFEEADDPTDRGFVGVEDGDNIYANNFFDSDASNQNTDAVGAADPKTTAEMKRIITFTNWDIAPTDTELNDGYPFLAWQDDRDDVAWLITGEELFCGGTGIENDPYLICTADELNNVRLRLDAYFRLENDIGLGVEPYNESEGWEPIGTTAARFTGSFDGDGHKISGLFINRPNTDYVGLFGLVDGGEVKNVGLENVNVTGEESVGGLVGSNPKGTVSNSYVTGDVSGVNVVGGLVGYNVEGTVSNSYATVDVSGVNVVGGLVGDNRDSTVSNSYATGEVTGERNVGGLVGRNNDGATVSNSYASVDVTGEDFVGGLVGDNRDGTVSNSYATGNVTRTSGTDRRFGGFVGNNVRSTIEYSFSTGSVFFEGADDPTDKGFVGGIEGDNTYTNNYFDSDASNQETDAVGAAAPKTTTEMKDIATFSADWDIAQSDTELNDGYPFLAWQLEGGSDESAWLIFEEPPLFCGGEGTETDPYLICTADQLNNVRDYMSDYFKLNNDIDLDEAPYNEGEGWEPIGDNADRFSGSFDGNGHKISGLFINRPNTDYVGLFGYVESGEVKNVGLENISVTGKDDVGGLIGQNIVATVSNSWSTGTVIGMNRVGGLVGDSYSGTVSNSYATGDVNGEGIVGGLVGRNEVGTVSNSYSAGDVTGNNSVGGLIGANFQGIVSNSYSLTDVSANYSAGGLVGFNQEGTVSNSYTTGNVTRTSGESTILGGFIGYNRDATIEYSYSTASVFYEGTVNPTDKGFVGIEFGTNTYTNNYFDSDASNQETDAVGAADPKTTTEMKDIATFFNNWDIAITDTELNDGYPFLAWQDDREDAIWLIYGKEMIAEEYSRLFVTANDEIPVTTDHLLFGSAENVTIQQLPYFGRLLLDGSEVEVSDRIEKSDVEAGKLVYLVTDIHGSTSYYDFDRFDYDNSEELRTLPIDLAAKQFPYDFPQGWFLFSSPGVNQTVGELLGNIHTQGFPGSNNPGASTTSVYTLGQSAYEWVAVTGSDQVLVQGTGLLVYVFEGDIPAEDLLVSGGPWAPLDGSFTYDDLLWYDPDQGQDGNSHFLIGNPHPVSINICNMLFNGANMATSIDIWAPWENDGHGGYINLSCDLAVTKQVGPQSMKDVSGSPEIYFDGYVPPFVGFWVRTTDENPSLAITEFDYVRMRAGKNSEARHEPITLVMSHDERNYSNTVNILFTDAGTEGLDAMDAIKLSPAGMAKRYLSFFAMDDENRKYALRSLPTLGQGEVTIPLGIETTEQGSYTLSWSLPADGFAGANVYLRDHHTGTTTQLRDGQTYRFEMEESMVAKDTNSPLERGSNDACGDAGVCPWMSASNATANAQAPRFELIITFDELKDGSSELPAEIVLRQNYPNPFNPATIITYELPQQVHVRLDVFDMTGRHVAELVNEQVSAGTHHVSFNAMNLSSGVYMYRLQAGGRVLSRQLTLIK